MELNRIEILEQTLRAYYILAKRQKSLWYCKKCRDMLHLLEQERAKEVYGKAA